MTCFPDLICCISYSGEIMADNRADAGGGKDGGLDGALREAETGRKGGRISFEMKEVRFSAQSGG